ncbi:MAG: hypothetical protein M3O91_07610 [Chloroflexota bacterium]|nr:hypothetical protein [Chloroflexota bacterium]
MRLRLIGMFVAMPCVVACGANASRKPAADTAGDGAAMETARAFARAPGGTAVTLTVAGREHYDRPVTGSANCSYGQENGKPTVKLEAFGRDAQVAFEIIGAHAGTIPVASGLGGRHGGPRVSSLQFVLHGQTYGDGHGSATITDPVGRSGSLTANRFSHIGVARHHGSDLSITVHWECE